MKLYNKTLLQLQFKANLSQTGACASCHAAEFHETKQYANEAVAKHRAISREIRENVAALIRQLDWYDSQVLEKHLQVVALKLPREGS
jgi:cytochrome c553